ncbi:MAG TPA: FHA domain-containing protein [Bryobacteraceae bacterium]|nr:FHA domain-containing protein [Bryobacteraceae bacterium]
MSILKRIEKTLDERLRRIFATPRDSSIASREAIELYLDALGQIRARGTVSIFERVRVELRAESPERRAVLEALFEPVQMLEDIRAALLEERVTAAPNLSVQIDFPESALVELRVFCEKAVGAPQAAQAPLRPARIGDFRLDRALINIGRVPEVVDAMGRTVRRNELCYLDEDTVSRVHAHVRFDGATGDWRIFDDGSTMGTALFREGRRIDVPPHAGRGVGLRIGDEIYFGSLRVAFQEAE